MEDHNTTEAVAHILNELEEARAQLKTVRDQLADALTQNEEYQVLAEEIKELANKRAEAKKLLLADNEFQKLNAEVEDYRSKIRDLQEIMSHHLVTYYNETQKTEITTGLGETRAVILTAKIGKPEIALDPVAPK